MNSCLRLRSGSINMSHCACCHSQIQNPISTSCRALFQRLLLVLQQMEFCRAFCQGECQSSSSLISLEDCVDSVPDLFVQHPYFMEHEELSFPSFIVGNNHQATAGVAAINDLDTFNYDFLWNKPESSHCSDGNNSVLISGSLHGEEYLNGFDQAPTENISSVITPDEMVGEGSLFPQWTEVMANATACLDEDLGFNKFENHDESDEGLTLKRKFHGLEVEKRGNHQNSTNSCENLKKRTKISKDGQDGSDRIKSKKGRKLASKEKYEEDEVKAVSDGQGCSSSSSESVASEGTVCGKIRASRGSATDPQSVYAKKRREKINERLRILQTLVPNGTKVDISTMLEDAVQYVKFLQLQIQLLSSDDLWMYAPLAHNGFDISLHQKMPLFQPK